jgi:hypothetical protein
MSRLLKTRCLKGETEMKNKSPMFTIVLVLVSLLVLLLLSACSPSQPVQDVREEEVAEIDIPAPPPEEAAPIEPPADHVVWMEDMIYPGAEFLFEVDGFGGPMTPWRFYAVPNVSGDELAEYYKQQLNWFVVEQDENLDGIRYLMLAHPAPMAFMDDADNFQEISQTMGGSLLGLEVSHSDVGAGLNRLGMAIDMHGIADQIPPNTIILILEYFQNIF